jgi:hypothetical protein
MNYNLVEAGRDIEASTPKSQFIIGPEAVPGHSAGSLIPAHGGVKTEGEQGKKMSRYGRPPVG